ncbi:MAG: hypothetical protein Ct9H300mP25_09860 [Acidobacteriota bacterium]|nr:MAG: hypothetical protein Ct9H300mP25_09860 [Acidobacteriota bacterium]
MIWEKVKDLIDAGGDASASNTLGRHHFGLPQQMEASRYWNCFSTLAQNPNAALKWEKHRLKSAARSGDHASVKLLIEHGADVNRAEFERGQTALMWAAAQQHADVVQLLVSNNADLEARTKVWHQLENTAGNTNPSETLRWHMVDRHHYCLQLEPAMLKRPEPLSKAVPTQMTSRPPEPVH